MTNPNNLNESAFEVEERERPLKEGAAPDRVGVYERPAQARSSAAWTVIIVAALLYWLPSPFTCC